MLQEYLSALKALTFALFRFVSSICVDLTIYSALMSSPGASMPTMQITLHLPKQLHHLLVV